MVVRIKYMVELSNKKRIEAEGESEKKESAQITKESEFLNKLY